MSSASQISFFRFRDGMHSLTIGKSLVYFTFLFLNLTITYRVLVLSTFSELMGILELVYVSLLAGYVGYRLVWRSIAQNFRINSFEILLVLLSCLPLTSAIAAKIEFDQPILWGILAFKDYYLFFGALVMYNLLRRGEIDLQLVEKAMIAVAWFNLLFFYAMSLFTNAADHRDSIIAGSQSAKGGEVYYRFSMAFIFFGAIYYSVKAFYQKKLWLFGYAALFLIYIVFFRLDRTSIMVTLVAVALFWCTALRREQRWKSVFQLILPATAALLVAYMMVPEVFQKYILMFTDAANTLMGNAAPSGQSWLRLHEMDIASSYIDKHPFIGNGRISNQWIEGGYNHFLGFFYPSDIGFMGQVFIYGYLGAILLYSQFLFALYYILKIKNIRRNVLLVTCKFYLLALFLDSLTNGFLTIYTAQTLTVVMLLFFFYQKDRNMPTSDKLRYNETKELLAPDSVR